MTNNRQCSGVTVLFTYTCFMKLVYMTQWCYGLKCLLSVGLSIRVAVAVPKVQTVVSCRPAFLANKKYM